MDNRIVLEPGVCRDACTCDSLRCWLDASDNKLLHADVPLEMLGDTDATIAILTGGITSIQLINNKRCGCVRMHIHVDRQKEYENALGSWWTEILSESRVGREYGHQ